MKFSGIIAAASMFVVGAVSQGTFDLSSLNGSCKLIFCLYLFLISNFFFFHKNLGAIGGLGSTLLVKIQTLTQIYNMTVNCPQVYITGNTNDTAYIQPSVEFGWYNSTSQSSQKANISLSGLMSFVNVTDDNGANFDVQFSLPSIARGLVANQVHMLNAALSGRNSSDPLPHGADYQANLFVKFVST
jgi:hypothetical protein